MTVRCIGGDAQIIVDTPRSLGHARLSVDVDGEFSSVSLDANHLRALAKLADAAADELDARAVGL